MKDRDEAMDYFVNRNRVYRNGANVANTPWREVWTLFADHLITAWCVFWSKLLGREIGF